MMLTGISGNEIYCLAQKGWAPGNIVVGNSVYSLGVLGTFASGMRTLAGGEVKNITQLISDGRHAAIKRLEEEAIHEGAHGLTGVTSELKSAPFKPVIVLVISDTSLDATPRDRADALPVRRDGPQPPLGRDSKAGPEPRSRTAGKKTFPKCAEASFRKTCWPPDPPGRKRDHLLAGVLNKAP